MKRELLYLDAAATTPVAPEVLEAMRPWFPARPDPERERAARAVFETRLADRLGVARGELRLVAGGSEANNLAVLGLARARAGRGRHVLSQPGEHPSVLRALEALGAEGFEVEHLPLDAAGRVDPRRVAAALRADTVLVALMRGHNETGVLQPLREVAELLAPRGVALHVDAVQSARHEPTTPALLGATTLTLTAHKLDGPKGVALLAGSGVAELPEPGGRGSPALALVAGLEAALARRSRLGASEATAVAASRDALERELLAAVPGGVVTGAGAPRLPGHLHLRIAGLSGEALVLELDQAGIAASTGAACSAAGGESRALLALGLSPAEVSSSLRLSLAGGLEPGQRRRVVQALGRAVARLRALGG